MFEAASAARSFVSEPSQRLPLAGTRIGASRAALWDRPLAAPPSPPLETTEYLHGDACRLAAREAQCRLVQAQLVAALVKGRLWRPLGFVRMADYAAERLGLRARSLQEDARVVAGLELLPQIHRALETGAIRWTHARLLVGVATPATEGAWLGLALSSTTRQLSDLVKAARTGLAGDWHEFLPSTNGQESRKPPDACASSIGDAGASRIPDACASAARDAGASLVPDACASSARDATALRIPDACASAARDAGASRIPDACALSARDATALRIPDACGSPAANAATLGSPDACASVFPLSDPVPDDDEDSDPPLAWTIVVTRAGRRLWRTVGDLASRMCGADLPASRVAEAVAAEAISWNAWEPPLAEPMPQPTRRRRVGVEPSEDRIEAPPAASALDPEFHKLLIRLDVADAHEIDRRLRSLRSSIQRLNADLGAVLRKALEHNVPRRLGFADLRSYAEVRLGVCGSKAMALVRLDRQCAQRSPALLRAYREGRITWLAATALLPVVSRQHEDAWVERGRQVTLRRLEAEVSWALDRVDDTGGRAQQAPPPLDLDVVADASARWSAEEIQMRAHPRTDLASFGRHVHARIRIVVPTSIAALLDDAIEGCRHAIEPRWRGFERILAHAWLTWMALPQHDNPVYARDNHRCQVPGCRSRAPLHAHHIWFRSKGGPDFSWNLTCVCDAHHQAIHRGEIHVHGRAPNHLVWELGCRPGRRPLLRFRGEVYWK